MVVVERRAPENTESSARIPLARPFERGEAPPRLASGALRCQTLAIVWKQALGVVAIAAGLGFGYVATSVATEGTGMALPEGADVVEGDVAEAPLRDAPFGDPFVFGEVRVSRSGSRAIEQSWSTVIGSPQVVLEGEGREERVTLPFPAAWKGAVPLEVRDLASLDEVELDLEADESEIRERLGAPPYVAAVRAVRPGDHVIGRRGDESLVDVYVGSRAELEEWIAQREQGRWPVVGLMGVMAFVSLLLGFRAFSARSKAA